MEIKFKRNQESFNQYLFMGLAFLMNIGINLAHPITPTLIKNAQSGDSLFGLAYAMMALGQLMSSLLWGNYAKRKGELSTTSISILVYCLGQILFFAGSSATAILIARFIAGCGAGGFMVATVSYCAKLSEQHRAQNLTFYTALTVMASTLGYLVGGILGDVQLSLVLLGQLVLMLAVALAFKMFLPEKNRTAETAVNSLEKEKTTTSDRLFLLLTMMSLFAATCYDQSFNYYLKDVLDFLPSQNGTVKAFVGVMAFIVSTFFAKHQKQNKEKNYLFILYGACCISLIGLMMTEQLLLFLFINTFFFVLNSLILPILQSLYLSRHQQQLSLRSGQFNMFKSVGMILGSSLAGAVYVLNPQVPFLVASGAFLLCAVLLILIVKMKKAEVGEEE